AGMALPSIAAGRNARPLLKGTQPAFNYLATSQATVVLHWNPFVPELLQLGNLVLGVLKCKQTNVSGHWWCGKAYID
ncbi:unnamed protein product, partial [Closterium sp. Naga37s-1]